jgi:hypothetical protein
VADPEIWRPAGAALAEWDRSGQSPQFWLRDDDATQPSAALEQLLKLTRNFEVPIAVAIIPAATGKDLAACLASHAHVVPIVHGWAHRNHAGAGEKKQEFGPHRPLETMREELSKALRKMKSLYPGRVVPMFVPPWNRIDPEVADCLGEAGYSALSRFGPVPDGPVGGGIAEINTHLDIMDWQGSRGCRDHETLVGLLAEALSQSLAGKKYPIGILTHHLVHDDAAWSFLEQLFFVTRGRRWLSARELAAQVPISTDA